MKLILVVAASVGVALAPAFVAASTPDGDAIKGKAVFARCASCHELRPNVNKVGPSLAGVIGRRSGSIVTFNYSPAMKQANLQWDAKTLDAFLTKPEAVVPDTRMPFPGLRDPADRANVIAYLATSTSRN